MEAATLMPAGYCIAAEPGDSSQHAPPFSPALPRPPCAAALSVQNSTDATRDVAAASPPPPGEPCCGALLGVALSCSELLHTDAAAACPSKRCVERPATHARHFCAVGQLSLCLAVLGGQATAPVKCAIFGRVGDVGWARGEHSATGGIYYARAGERARRAVYCQPLLLLLLLLLLPVAGGTTIAFVPHDGAK
ncbi:hypothetical protein DAKH74_001160 [Maudiozyma humilis]|uniref:Uncharacterized protein n=1 Tax=Maudiozyma humilis TaxID=51915 RepID=A0AAV5RPS3_MAUHU|nr:hypothetical protein DAKH74_001160 [Kazachstania humilis]